MTRLIAALLLILAATANAGRDQDEARELAARGVILPLSTILEKARQIHDGRVLEVELELEHEREHGGYVYELEILDAQGVVWELEFNAVSGELIERGKE